MDAPDLRQFLNEVPTAKKMEKMSIFLEGDRLGFVSLCRDLILNRWKLSLVILAFSSLFSLSLDTEGSAELPIPAGLSHQLPDCWDAGVWAPLALSGALVPGHELLQRSHSGFRGIK